jgi:hypothetical protein
MLSFLYRMNDRVYNYRLFYENDLFSVGKGGEGVCRVMLFCRQ